MAKKVQGFLLYRIYYGDTLVYVGRTKQPLQTRIRGHLFAKPMHRTIAIEQVTRIEYARLKTEADMNLYEIYYILKWKPPLNVDDKTRDSLTIRLPDLIWLPFVTEDLKPQIWQKWQAEIESRVTEYDLMKRRYHEIPEAKALLRSMYNMGEIDEAEMRRGLIALDNEKNILYDKMRGGPQFW